MTVPELHETVEERLRRHRQRYTGVRRSLVDMLADADGPLALPDILAVRSHPQSSVYRNLSVLESAGVVHRIVTHGEHARYELAEDLSQHHHHLICASCGRVEDFVTPSKVERAVEHAVGEAARNAGFQPRAHRIDMIGLCRDCS
ncbi:MAG TPA: Fur family transcriptional regulator [Actinomycetota bacterium]|nr:Fur family transcriptional regulator [Actinomycetota bacterium]